jgi:hypothetical protein
VSIEELIQQGMEVGRQLAPSTAIAAVLAAVVLLLCSWPWRALRSPRRAVAGVLGVCSGLFAGWWWLGARPHWPPREDQDRLLLILFPAVIVVEMAAAFLSPILALDKKPSLQWLAWLPRLVVAALAGRILLHDTSYLADLSGPGSRQWTPEQTWIILGSMAVALLGVWYLLTRLTQQAQGRAVPLTVAIACGGTAVVMMMSGYASGGPLAMPLAGAVVGIVVASLILKGDLYLVGVLGVAVVGLFGLLVIGHFFGELTWTNAALLFFAPLFGWLPELPLGRRIRPRLRATLGVVLTAIPVAIALALAQQKFIENSAPPSSDSQEPTLEDYMNFGK